MKFEFSMRDFPSITNYSSQFPSLIVLAEENGHRHGIRSYGGVRADEAGQIPGLHAKH